jgi:ABC-type uncharacterized transport system involved in gliding motility auxiliary subunit
MEMKPWSSSIGWIGAGLAVAGVFAYSLAPDKLWLVALCEGLALIGLLAFLGAHVAEIKAYMTRRSTLLGANSLLTVVLVAGILVIMNFLAARHSTRWDLSETQHFTLAPQTHKVLRGLTQDVKITVFAQERGASGGTYRDLLDSYKAVSDKIKVEFVDPERKPGIARQYGITRVDTAVLESGANSTRVTTASEAELTGGIIRVSKDAKKRIVFLEGHGERSIQDREREGLTTAKDALEKQSYEVATLSLLQETAVPANTSVLVLAGPKRPLTQDEVGRMSAYVSGGGRLLLLLDPEPQGARSDFLKTWGVLAGPGVLVDLQDRLAMGDLTSLMIRTFTEHEITQDFSFAVLFPVSQHLTFHEDAGKEWDFVPLARTSARSWAETTRNGRVVNFDEKEDIRGPLAMAAALTPKKAPEEGQKRPALVVVGNSAFASNAYVNYPGNQDFLLHALGWLAEERDLISITPKEPAFRPFIPNPAQERTLLYVQVLFLPALTLFWGLRIWRRRRRL